jgi:hypothetical protein
MSAGDAPTSGVTLEASDIGQPACAGASGRCPGACVAVCLLVLRCPDCGAHDGAWCARPSGHKASEIHESRLREADRATIELRPDTVTAALGADGLALWRRLLGMDDQPAGARARRHGRRCPVAARRCESADCAAHGCLAM